MRIFWRLHLLITAGELSLLVLISRTRTTDADNSDESLNLSHLRHLAEADHRGTFYVMHGTRATAGDHLPHFGVLPRFQTDEVSGNAARVERLLRITHHGQTALRENIHFHQADCFHRVHIEMRRG